MIVMDIREYYKKRGHITAEGLEAYTVGNYFGSCEELDDGSYVFRGEDENGQEYEKKYPDAMSLLTAFEHAMETDRRHDWRPTLGFMDYLRKKRKNNSEGKKNND